MSLRIEDWLEAAYFSEWEKHFTNLYQRPVRSFKFLKNEEALVGADWAWTSNAGGFISQQKLVKALLHAILDKKNVSVRFLAYFHQYKVVEQMNDIIHLPKTKRAELQNFGYSPKSPYFRAELAASHWHRDKTSKLTQHETLYRLASIQGAHVSYICPMVFDERDIQPKKRNLNQLVQVTVDSTAPIYGDDSVHHLYFSDKLGSNAVWMSEPTRAEISAIEQFPKLDNFLTPEKLVQFLDSITQVLASPKISQPVRLAPPEYSSAESIVLLETVNLNKLPESFRLLAVDTAGTMFEEYFDR